MNEKLKKLTDKNPKDFKPVAFDLINNSDVDLFAKLVEQENFLFDFVKQNVARRLQSVCNSSNYLNLLNFLKYYSPSYEEFIVSTLANYADEDLTDKMLELFEDGTIAEKTYCAKFFSYIQDPLAIEFLNKYAWNEDNFLSSNCASTLAILGEKDEFNKALTKLKSEDDFEKLDAVKFLISYKDKRVVEKILEALKNTSMPENIAGELLYLTDWFSIFEKNQTDALFVLNLIINGLGEILPISCVFDYQLYDIFEMLINKKNSSELGIVLYNALEKFNILTENDEYLFDETKDTKQEVLQIKTLLETQDIKNNMKLCDEELKEDSLFIFTALEYSQNTEKIRKLLSVQKPAIIIKSLEVLKTIDKITTDDRNTALNSIKDENLKAVVLAI